MLNILTNYFFECALIKYIYRQYNTFYVGGDDMLFNSFHFLVFFVIVILLYFILPFRFRWILLLVSSSYFYMAWRPEYIILIIISTFVDYYASIKMGQQEEKSKRKKYLILSICSNLGLLFFFKYTMFFNESFRSVFSLIGFNYKIPTFNILLPMGISFYTFQTMSYTIDVYKGKIKPEKHFGIFALYVSFFPQLVAGPIERSEHLLPQFYNNYKFDIKRIIEGLQLMTLGFFKKVVIADRTAMMVNTIYNQPDKYQGLYFIIATVLFAFQIFCDLSGYSDIAIGIAKVMGIDLMTNFRQPYFATSIQDFWRRWHISLSTWFKDYVYIPLGGSKINRAKFYRNIFITFMISGLWHGASWTFVIWGLIHALYQIIGHVTKRHRERLIHRIKIDKFPKVLKIYKITVTFTLVCFAWIFFRANNLYDAYYIITHLFIDIALWSKVNYWFIIMNNMGVSLFEASIVIISIGWLIIIEWLNEKKPIQYLLMEKPFYIRWAFYYILLIFIITWGVFYNASEFIYFQF